MVSMLTINYKSITNQTRFSDTFKNFYATAGVKISQF